MILDEICEHKRQEVQRRKAEVPLSKLEEEAALAPAPGDFRGALRQPGISLIAEVKHASPSRGILVENWDPVALSSIYQRSGARAVSVLTDEKYFQGSLDDLQAVRYNVSIPCLRKDFVIDPYQVYEARAARADAILLIVRALTDAQLKEYLALARKLGLAALVETHDEEEIRRALDAGAHIIGINNRDLATFGVDLRTSLELKRLVPGGVVLVSESGIHTRSDVRLLEDGGFDAILVGEALVTSDNVHLAIRRLLQDDEG